MYFIFIFTHILYTQSKTIIVINLKYLHLFILNEYQTYVFS